MSKHKTFIPERINWHKYIKLLKEELCENDQKLTKNDQKNYSVKQKDQSK